MGELRYIAGLTVLMAMAGDVSAAKLGLQRNSYGVFDRTGGYTTQEYPFLAGQEFTSGWEAMHTGPNSFYWDELDAALEFAYEQKVPIVVRFLPVGLSWDAPDWLNTIGGVDQFSDADYTYADYKDPYYKTSFSNMVMALGKHLREDVEPHLLDQVSFVRVEIGATSDPVPFNNGIDPPDVPSHYHFTATEWEEYSKWAFELHIKSFQEGVGKKLPLRFSTNENETPGLWDWCEANVFNGLGSKLNGGLRGHHLTFSKADAELWSAKMVDSDKGYFSINEMDQTWQKPYFQRNVRLGMYWCAVEQLHAGLSVWDVTASCLENTYIDDYEFAFDFFNKWAAELVPATAGGGFCILHEGLNSADVIKFPEAAYGNASKSNTNRYVAICADPVYYNRGARMDDPASATVGQVLQRREQTGFNDCGWEIIPENYERFIHQLDPDGTSIGLWRVRGTLTTASHPYDRFARSFDAANGKNTMYFDVNDDLVDVPTQPLQLSVIYLDQGTGSFELQYHAQGDLTKSAFVVNKTNSNEWKTNTVVITDGLFQNGCTNNSDLVLLNLDSDDDILHMLELIKLSGVTVNTAGHGSVTGRHGKTEYETVSGTYMEGYKLEVAATPDPGWLFAGWSGTMDEVRDNWARFYPATETTVVTANFIYTGEISCSDDFESDSWAGGTGWAGGWSRSGGTSLNLLNSNRSVLLDSSGTISRTMSPPLIESSLSFYWDADSLDSESETAEAEVYDGSWHTVWTVSQADCGNDDSSSPDALTLATIDLSAYGEISQVRFILNAPGVADRIWLDDISLEGSDASVSNNAPTFLADPFSKSDALAEAPYRESISSDAADPEQQALSFYKISGPEWLNVNTNGMIWGSPATSDVGSNTFSVSATDPDGYSDLANLEILVKDQGPSSFFLADFEGSQAQPGIVNRSDPTPDPYGGVDNLNAGTSIGTWSASQLLGSSVYTNLSANQVLFAGTDGYALTANLDSNAMITNTIQIDLNYMISRTGGNPDRRNFITGLDDADQDVFKIWLSGNTDDDGGKTLYLETAGSTLLLASNIARRADNSFLDAEMDQLGIGLSTNGIRVSLNSTELTNGVALLSATDHLSKLLFEGDSMWYDNLEVASEFGGETVLSYGIWAGAYALEEMSGGDDDQDGYSNLFEYSLNGNPTNASDSGYSQFYPNNRMMTFAYASNSVDSTMHYRLVTRTNLVSGATQTNDWVSQSLGPEENGYTIVSNHFDLAEKSQLFLHLQVER